MIFSLGLNLLMYKKLLIFLLHINRTWILLPPNTKIVTHIILYSRNILCTFLFRYKYYVSTFGCFYFYVQKLVGCSYYFNLTWSRVYSILLSLYLFIYLLSFYSFSPFWYCMVFLLFQTLLSILYRTGSVGLILLWGSEGG